MDIEELKLNISGGPKRVEGFQNVDALPWDGATDVLHDLTVFPYPFPDEVVSEILSQETLEHISWRHTGQVLKEFYRILQRKGKLSIQVPDCGQMMDDWVENRICECVPHKPIDVENAKADPDCRDCFGLAVVHPDRWLMAFTGAQKHEFDYHRNIFTKNSLHSELVEAGFIVTEIKSDKYNWKIIANCVKV